MKETAKDGAKTGWRDNRPNPRPRCDLCGRQAALGSLTALHQRRGAATCAGPVPSGRLKAGGEAVLPALTACPFCAAKAAGRR